MHPTKSSNELIGRTEEKDRLRVLLQRAQQSHGQVALLVGDAGIGKTRLLTYLTHLGEENRFTVLRGECLEQDRNSPYAPIIDGLRTHFSGATAGELRQIIEPFQHEMVKLLPELALQIEAAPTATQLDPAAEKRRLFEILVRVYQRLTDSGLLLIFEDIHWSDPNSLEFFQTLTRRIHHLPIMMALSSRPAAPTSEPATLRLYFDRAENAHVLPLSALTDTEVDTLVKTVLPTPETIHPRLLDDVYALTQGNPLYTEQIVYMLLQNRQFNLVNGVWMLTSSARTVEIPTSIAQTVKAQLERLSDDAIQILRLAAVAGRQFALNTLAQLTDFDEPYLLGLVKELISRRFVDEVSRDRFAFRHALLRQVIYDSLLIRERQVLHEALLHILEESESTFRASHLTELSYHAYEAEVWEAALRYGIQAGQHAMRLHSPRVAVEHFSHAIEAAQQLGEPVSWKLYMQRGEARDNLGEFQPALDDYESALRVAVAAGDRVAEWETLITIALLWAARDYHVTETYCRRALQLAQSIEDPRLIGHSLNRLGNWYLNIGESFQALDYHKRALSVFEELDDLPGKGETLDLLGMTSGHVLHLADQLAYYRSAVEIFRELDDRKALASALSNLTQCTYDPRYAEEAIDIARQIGWHSGEVYAYNVAGYVHSAYGRFTQSLAYIQHGLGLARVIDHSQWLAGLQVFSGFVYRALLDLETAASNVEQGVALADTVGSHWFVAMGSGLLAQIYIDQGNLDAAGEILAQHIVPDPPVMQYLMVMLAEADLALAHGDAEAVLASNKRLQDTWPLDYESVPLSAFGTVPYLMRQARALAMLDCLDEALEQLRQARTICEGAGLLPDLWQVDVSLGELVARRDDKAARAYFKQARACIDQLAANIPADRRQQFQQRAESRIQAAQTADFRPHMHGAGARAAQFQLTRRELDVVREVASGKTNQQIADTLHITVKTVETHLTRILSKLDMTSRTQVALWAADNDLTP